MDSSDHVMMETTSEDVAVRSVVISPRTRPASIPTSQRYNASENDVLVVFVAQQVFAVGCVFCFGAVFGIFSFQPCSFLDCGVPLFLAGYFFQAVELFSVKLV
jgi:hypothetical protein